MLIEGVCCAPGELALQEIGRSKMRQARGRLAFLTC